jgi:hypothetical protein
LYRLVSYPTNLTESRCCLAAAGLMSGGAAP